MANNSKELKQWEPVLNKNRVSIPIPNISYWQIILQESFVEFDFQQKFVEFVTLNNLALNITETKELILDFRRNRTAPAPLHINGECVEQVESSSPHLCRPLLVS
ncbi:KRAB domain-containing zinc finger protein [Sarotherodon galilaeus]